MDFKDMSPEWRENAAHEAQNRLDRMERQKYSVFKIKRYEHKHSFSIVAAKMVKDGPWVTFYDPEDNVSGFIRTKDIEWIFRDGLLTMHFRKTGSLDPNDPMENQTEDKKPEWVPVRMIERPSYIPEYVSLDLIIRIFSAVYDETTRNQLDDYLVKGIANRPDWIPVQIPKDVINKIFTAVYDPAVKKEIGDYVSSLYYKK